MRDTRKYLWCRGSWFLLGTGGHASRSVSASLQFWEFSSGLTTNLSSRSWCVNDDCPVTVVKQLWSFKRNLSSRQLVWEGQVTDVAQYQGQSITLFTFHYLYRLCPYTCFQLTFLFRLHADLWHVPPHGMSDIDLPNENGFQGCDVATLLPAPLLFFFFFFA